MVPQVGTRSPPSVSKHSSPPPTVRGTVICHGGGYLSWILPLVLQQLLQVNLEGEPALSQVSAQLGHTQQVRPGA